MPTPSRIILFLLICLLGLSGRAADAAEPFRSKYSEAALVAERGAIMPGETLQVGLRLKHIPGWHSYWRNPGDSGLPTEIAWNLPPGWQAGDIQWPAPHRMPIEGLVNYGFEGEFVLPVALSAPADAKPGDSATLQANATWLVCEKICVPEEAELSLALPVVDAKAEADPRYGRLFTAAALAQPKPSPWNAVVGPAVLAGNETKLTLHVAAQGLQAARLGEVYFFPYDGNALNHAASQPLRLGADGLQLTLKRGIDANKPIAPLDGVLVLTEKLDGGNQARQAFELRAEPGVVPVLAAATAIGGMADGLTMPGLSMPGSDVGMLQAILLAFLGGLILNVMPCVFPVLFMKALAFARLGHGHRAEVRREGLAYTAGVLATFALLAGTMLVLREGGAAIGWGYQLQHPVVVLLLAYLMALVGFNLMGLFELRGGGNIGAALAGKGGSTGAFFTGALAVVVATPCTAPFMGAAMGFALTAPKPAALAVFLALGLGLALPFLLFSLLPGLARLLPKPGAWMQSFRQFLAFPMFVTAAWLIWVLAQQTGPDTMLAALLGVLALAFAAWAWGKLGQGRGRPIGMALAVAGVAAALLLLRVPLQGMDNPAPAGNAANMPGPKTSAMDWNRFDADAIAEARGQGRPVLVNMTAAWCITCLVNEGAALSSADLAGKLQQRNVLLLKGDWTRRDPAITRYLNEFGRSGVPLYVLYPADPAKPPVVLPQLLTEGMVVDALNRL